MDFKEMLNYQAKFKPGDLLRTTAFIGAFIEESGHYIEVPPNTIFLFLVPLTKDTHSKR